MTVGSLIDARTATNLNQLPERHRTRSNMRVAAQPVGPGTASRSAKPLPGMCAVVVPASVPDPGQPQHPVSIDRRVEDADIRILEVFSQPLDRDHRLHDHHPSGLARSHPPPATCGCPRPRRAGRSRVRPLRRLRRIVVSRAPSRPAPPARSVGRPPRGQGTARASGRPNCGGWPPPPASPPAGMPQ